MLGKENHMNSFSCVITGHRPTRFKFKYNEKDKRCQRIKKCLQEQLIRLYNQGVRCFWVGGAMGADMWAAEILLRMKEQTMYQDVELCLALPFEGYDAGWDDWHRKRMGFTLQSWFHAGSGRCLHKLCR